MKTDHEYIDSSPQTLEMLSGKSGLSPLFIQQLKIQGKIMAKVVTSELSGNSVILYSGEDLINWIRENPTEYVRHCLPVIPSANGRGDKENGKSLFEKE